KNVQETCYKTVQEVQCKPVTCTVWKEVEYCVNKPCYQQGVKEVCETVCKPVCETCYKECHYTVCKKVPECCMKECFYKVCKPVCSMKTVQKKCGEWCCESYCVPGKKHTEWVDTCDCCFDPCTCQTQTKHHKVKVCCEGCPETKTRKVWKEHVVCEQ